MLVKKNVISRRYWTYLTRWPETHTPARSTSMSGLASLTERDKNDAVDVPKPACWVCGAEKEGAPMHCGCGCVGLAGHVHLDCAVAAAREEWERWFDCRTCGQRWTGKLKLALARARLDLMSHRPAHDAERQSAEEMLSEALRDARELAMLAAEREALRKRQSSAPEDHAQQETDKGMVV